MFGIFCLAFFSLILFLELFELLLAQAAYDIIRNVDKEFKKDFFSSTYNNEHLFVFPDLLE